MKIAHSIKFIALQESKVCNGGQLRIAPFWGRSRFEFDFVDAAGRSGGLISIWDPFSFAKLSARKSSRFLVISGKLSGVDAVINIANIYAPNDQAGRRLLWDELDDLICSLPGMWILMGDFNVVRSCSERLNSVFDESGAEAFNGFIANTGLIDLNMGGGRFTYMSGCGSKLSKLDRFLVCDEFRDRWPFANTLALPWGVSDHRPIVMTIGAGDFGHIPFRFYNSWLEKPGFVEFVEDSCRQFRFEGNASLAISTKLRWLKNRIRLWIRSDNEIRNSRISDLKACLCNLDGLAEQRGLSSVENNLRAHARNLVLEDDKLKRLDLLQKSRSKWAVDGDENSSFFHGVINANLGGARINGLRRSEEWVSNPLEIKEMVADYFASRLSEQAPVRPRLVFGGEGPSLDTALADRLVAPFLPSEIKNAVWECYGDRAPGPDGFNFRFVKKFWDYFASDFLLVFEDFHSGVAFHEGWAPSFIALIPKDRDPLGLNDYRPISLVGCLNKVLSKVLLNRLKLVIDSLISGNQFAFIAKRNILDGPLILNEIFAWLKSVKKAGMFLKIDIEKAYDSLSWDFLESVLVQMRFPTLWISWVMTIVRSARASVLVNGSPTNEFVCSRGLRQGDPLSPFLFLIAMEAFSCVMRKAEGAGIFKGLRIASGPTISHLLFADDAVIIGEWSMENVSNISRILRCFHMASGLKINLSKSRFYGIEVTEADAVTAAAVLRCDTGSFPFKYLGLWVGANLNRVRNWDPIIEKVRERLSLWKAKHLSMAGRLVLVKSVMNALPTYYFSLYRAPQKVIDSIDRLRRNFLWGGSDVGRKIHWVAWHNVVKPRENGGLGVGSLKDCNVALLAKWWWRFKVEKDSLWRKVIWAIHHSSRSWNIIPVSPRISGPWKNIGGINKVCLGTGFDLGCGIKAVVGSGSAASFWSDCWLPSGPLSRRFPLLFALDKDKGVCVSGRVVSYLGGIAWSWNWKRNSFSDAELSELMVLLPILFSVFTSSGPDRWVWEGDASGVFSVHSVRTLLRSGGAALEGPALGWKSWVPKKVVLLAWRASMDRLPTRSALCARGIQLPTDVCPMCGDFKEDAAHLFLECGLAQSIWDKVSKWCNIPNIFAFTVTDLIGIHKHLRGSFEGRMKVDAVMMTALWSIWNARNRSVFDGASTTVDFILGMIKASSFFWVKNRGSLAGLSWEDWCNDW